MSLIVCISFPCGPGPFTLRVRSAGHALNLNKGCTKRQSLPNCQQNGRPGPEYRTGKHGKRCYFGRNGTEATALRSGAGGSFPGKDTGRTEQRCREQQRRDETKCTDGRPRQRGRKNKAAESGPKHPRGSTAKDGNGGENAAATDWLQQTGHSRQAAADRPQQTGRDR